MTGPGNQACVKGQSLSPVPDLLVDVALAFFVVVENVVTAETVPEAIKADDVLRVWWAEWCYEKRRED